MKPALRDYFQLHFVVLIFGFTAILGRLMTIPALSLVFWRTGLAAAGMWLFWKFRPDLFTSKQLSRPTQIRLLLTGGIVAAHWILFFGSARVSNVSVCLAGMSTSSFWTALLEPLFRKKAIKPLELLFGLLVVGGLYLIFLFEFNHALGLAMSLISAMLAALFSVFNSLFSEKVKSRVITTYEMTGACLSTGLFLFVYYWGIAPNESVQIIPQGWDWLWVLILAGVCTIYAYSVFVNLFRKFSAFVMNLTVNLEPIYGILLAFCIFGEAEKMNTGFYLGAILILGAVLLYPLFSRWSRKRSE
ncbi:MAG: DMT family transporter [Siphonobacter sp.]